MISLRSQETLQREYDLQAEYTTRINTHLQNGADDEFKAMLEDRAVFANVLRKVAPENTLVILHDRPEIILIGEGEDYKVSLFLNGAYWRFKVNGSVHYTMDAEGKFGPSRHLFKIWQALIPSLPEGFIVVGKVDPNDPPEETAARTTLQQKLGFGSPQDDDAVYGMVVDKKLCPLTLGEFTSLTKGDVGDQKFNVRKVEWGE